MQEPTNPPVVVSRRHRVVFAAIVVVSFAVLTLGAFLATDWYAHRRTQLEGGVNIWGYRGHPVGRKPLGGIRLVMLGGSTAYGWGLPAHESIAAALERRLQTLPALAGRHVSVVNLGAPAQGAFGFIYDLEDYAYLAYDMVVLYEGLNDLGPYVARGINNDYLFRRESPIFRLTGYYPVLPVVLRERARVMMAGGDLNAAYDPRKVVFTPGLATRATAAALRTAAAVGDRVSEQLGGLSDNPAPPKVEADCVPAWQLYCGRVKAAVTWALERNKRVVFVTQPYMSDAHVEQQANVAAMLKAAFAGDSRLDYVNLGRLIDMSDRSIAYDGVHLVARGNDLVASQLVDPILQLLEP